LNGQNQALLDGGQTGVSFFGSGGEFSQ